MTRSSHSFFRNIIAILLGVYLSNTFVNFISPKIQIFIDTSMQSVNNSIQIFLFDREYLDLFPDDNGVYTHQLEIYSEIYNLEMEVDNNSSLNCKVNGEEFLNCEKISNFTSSYLYENAYCIKLNAVSPYHYILLTVFTIILVIILLYISNFELISKDKHYRFLITYSNSAFRCIGWKPILLSFAVTLFTMIFYYGCDLTVISESIIIYQNGIDIYQMFASLNEYRGAELLMWQYDGPMLAGYNLLSQFCRPFLHFFNPYTYHWIQSVEYKLINIILYNLLSLSLISFLIDKNYLSEYNAPKIYYWSIFNPLTFYTAIIFIQFDILPAYLITLGILLLTDIKKNKILSATLIAIGISCKMTLFLFIPSVSALVLFIMLKEKQISKHKISFLFISFFWFIVLLIIPRLYHTPISIALGNLAQAERIWFTTIQYAPTVFLFISIYCLVIFFILNIYKINLKLSKENLILNTFYFTGVIVLVFSSTTLSTPSFFIQTIPAFTLLFVNAKDNFQRFCLSLLGVLIVTNIMFMPEGDITASLSFIGKTPVFISVKNIMTEKGLETRWVSILHTISSAAMMSFAIIFANKAKELLN